MDNKTSVKNYREQLLKARNKSLDLFGDIAHRIESCRNIEGVEWINDSKSTDLDSAYYSLELMNKPVVWIIGSTTTQGDYAIFEKLLKFKVKSVICFGNAETRIKYSVANLVDVYAHKSTLKEAIEFADEISKSGDAVLFSPACSSFETYEDFRDRGNCFKAHVSEL